jgi:hypothetical protein
MERNYTTISIDRETLNLIKANKLWYEKSHCDAIKRVFKVVSCKKCSRVLCPEHQIKQA